MPAWPPYLWCWWAAASPAPGRRYRPIARGGRRCAEAAVRQTIGNTYKDLGLNPEAQGQLEAARALRAKAQGEKHPDTLSVMENLAEVSFAEALHPKVLEMEGRVLGEEHPTTLATMHNLAALHRSQARYAEAEQLDMKVLEIRRRTLGSQHPDITDTMASLSEPWILQHRYSDAEPLIREALNIVLQASPDSRKRYYLESLLGATLTGQKRYAEAEPLLLSGYVGIHRKATIPASSNSNLKQAGESVLQLYRDWGQPEKAAEWEAKLEPMRP